VGILRVSNFCASVRVLSGACPVFVRQSSSVPERSRKSGVWQLRISSKVGVVREALFRPTVGTESRFPRRLSTVLASPLCTPHAGTPCRCTLNRQVKQLVRSNNEASGIRARLSIAADKGIPQFQAQLFCPLIARLSFITSRKAKSRMPALCLFPMSGKN
jgi:hypothetical protein